MLLISSLLLVEEPWVGAQVSETMVRSEPRPPAPQPPNQAFLPKAACQYCPVAFVYQGGQISHLCPLLDGVCRGTAHQACLGALGEQSSEPQILISGRGRGDGL